jgi:hypothetical protein
MCVMCVKKPWGTHRMLETELNVRFGIRCLILFWIASAARNMDREDETE